jgi:isochorismate pyruvate lyase
MEMKRVYTGAPWEQKVGYCRAILAGTTVAVTGTAPVADDGSTFAPGDPEAQAARCFALIDRALTELGVDKTCIIRTRMFVTDISKWQEFGRAHAAYFAGHHPATSMIEVKGLIDPDMLIEIEADGVVG